ncbi:MAG: NUDIX domain-containing protein [Candidatus Micrarchaeales archaeon]|jgi:DNA polymerase|uniref:Bis(5'-nucleosyl)-tetraphosphatase [asymmetrical] n=1 Tax=Candidatus Micrarchaeum acidiphilum ARMAN-2 TaxID=425595 RepID=C7DGM0_MICA2|nr:MAG: phage SPO1 DNA polymerase-related protein [Candidatus Micrarchaeum acidiphilum ARMAN-2]MCW6161227.1 NUDIX domain-containing protein [Candidatus Micrarchaeales archaeon]
MKFEFSAGVVVYSECEGVRHFLILKRNDGKFDFPKGHIEKGEKAQEAAVRETYEETHLKVEIDRYFRRDIRYWFYKDGEKISKKLSMFLAKADSEEGVKISYEHTGFEWLTAEDAIEKLNTKDRGDIIASANRYAESKRQMDILNLEYSRLFDRFENWSLSSRFVPGEGPLDARIMFLGQAPGSEEDKTLRPFVGRSGMLLTDMIKRAGLDRDKAYITSVVQFFPPRNRAPSSFEIDVCKPFLFKQIDIVKPGLVVLLGNVAMLAVLGRTGVSSMHGTVVEKDGVRYFITLHPSAALRIKSKIPIIEADFKKLGSIVRDLI